MATKTFLSVGVEKFSFSLSKACVHNANISAAISFSFKLSGRFLKAALTDDINNTVDYEALSLYIEKACRSFNCGAHPTFCQHIETTITQFSPLITAAYFSFSWTCHRTFTLEHSFAIPHSSQITTSQK